MKRSRYGSQFVALLVALLIASTSAAAESADKPGKLKKEPSETVIYVADLHCKTCAKKISRKLFAVKGVVKVRTDLKANVAIVTPQKKKQLDPLALWAAAQESGFPAVKLVGPDGTYVPHPETKEALKETDDKAAEQS